MTGPARFECPARMESLPQATAFVDRFCQSRAASHSDRLRLTLILEELFTNTVRHGHRDDSAASVRIGLRAESTLLTLLYDDTAQPFDPVAHVAKTKPPTHDEATENTAGALGLLLVVNMASSISYLREHGMNRLRVVLLRQA